MRAPAVVSLFLATVLFVWTGHAAAQERPPLTNRPAWEREYRFLADPARRTDVLDPLKYIPLGEDPDVYLSLGGELRERFEAFTKRPLAGVTGLDNDDYLLHRSVLHADLHLGRPFRTFVQLGYHDVIGKEGVVTPTERSGLDLQQAFAEARLDVGAADSQAGKERLVLRLGRQEMPFGSQRIVTQRDGPNMRLSFDGLRVNYERPGMSLSTFVTRPVLTEPGGFDDDADHKQLFWGGYGVFKAPGGLDWLNVDLYVLKLDRDDARFAQGLADERRVSLGTRLWGETGAWDYNFEFLYQFGDFGNADIRAWTASSDTGYALESLPLAPRLGLKASVASGDRDLGDDTLETFSALFPRASFFTESGLFGPSNFMDLQPNVTLNVLDNLTVTPAVDFLWRQSTDDAIYRQPNVPIARTAGNPARFTGSQWQLTSTWTPDPHVEVNAAYVYFASGQAIRDAGGGDSQYLGLWAAYRF